VYRKTGESHTETDREREREKERENERKKAREVNAGIMGIAVR